MLRVERPNRTIPLAAFRAFMRDLTAFFNERDSLKRDLIARRQMRALWNLQRPGDRRVDLRTVKEAFHAYNEIFQALGLFHSSLGTGAGRPRSGTIKIKR